MTPIKSNGVVLDDIHVEHFYHIPSTIVYVVFKYLHIIHNITDKKMFTTRLLLCCSVTTHLRATVVNFSVKEKELCFFVNAAFDAVGEFDRVEQ